jgi:hypothetical protein
MLSQNSGLLWYRGRQTARGACERFGSNGELFSGGNAKIPLLVIQVRPCLLRSTLLLAFIFSPCRLLLHSPLALSPRSILSSHPPCSDDAALLLMGVDDLKAEYAGKDFWVFNTEAHPFRVHTNHKPSVSKITIKTAQSDHNCATGPTIPTPIRTYSPFPTLRRIKRKTGCEPLTNLIKQTAKAREK